MTAANAYSPHEPETGQAEARSSEPSMEDILASIRRIIADDQLHGTKPSVSGSARRPPGALAPVQTAEAAHPAGRPSNSFDEVLDLARVSTGGGQRSPHTGDARPLPAPIAFDPEPAGDEAEPGYEMPLAPEHDMTSQSVAQLRKANGSASILRARLPEPPSPNRQDMQSMAPQHTAGYQDRSYGMESAAGADPLISPRLGASVMSAFETLAASVVLQNTDMLDRIMRELLRPMLKTWLDDNLPTLVERLVRAEIERVARGGRG